MVKGRHLNILYFTTPIEDYIQDQMLIGLRSLYGNTVIDYPKKEVLYKTCDKTSDELYGCGFSIWKTLPDIVIDRANVFQKIKDDEFDIIFISSIWRQKFFLYKMCSNLSLITTKAKIIFLDGEDYSNIYIPALFFGRYYKREMATYIGRAFTKAINFSMPNEKILMFEQEKKKLFAKHVQCEEAYKISEIKENCQHSYAFSDESAYYKDIASSYYAITMKKAGWECMRHYEIAGNGTVPCFYRFSEKPVNSAPHGLVDMKNMLTFNTAEELMKKVEQIEKENRYSELRSNALAWAKDNSCTQLAKTVVDNVLRA